MADRRLQVFDAVARQLSFTKAGKTLFMSQPAVTHQIKQLEEHFHTPLFDRSRNSICLTPAGELVQVYASTIVGLSFELEKRLGQMTREIAGPLLVGGSATVAALHLPHILAQFKRRYPGVHLRLSVANTQTIEARLAEHSLDVGFVDSAYRQHNLRSEPCCEDELQAVCSPRFALARRRELSASAMVGYPYVSREPDSGTWALVDAFLRAAGVLPDAMNLVMELGSPEALKAVVEAGLGFAIMSRALVSREQALGTLIAIPLSPRLTRTFAVVYPKQRLRTRLVNTFVAFAVDHFKTSESVSA
jgi:DNA-binding transcriptional LysR family regulator